MLFNNKYRKGISIPELLISTFALSILMLGFSQFAANVFDVSASHASQIVNVNNARLSTERIITQINKSVYIYPANISIHISDNITINTNSAVAMLIPSDNEEYNFVAYYFKYSSGGKSDLYEFMSDYTYEWSKNTCPATDMLTFGGSSSLLATNINISNTTLQYIINYSNGSYDQNLKGGVSNVNTNNTYALIKGINWKIYNDSLPAQIIQLKGISRNVPRFAE